MIVLLMCLLFYILSFAQMLLPVSVELKGILWLLLFGTAKLTQYSGLAIIGAEGIKRIKQKMKV